MAERAFRAGISPTAFDEAFRFALAILRIDDFMLRRPRIARLMSEQSSSPHFQP